MSETTSDGFGGYTTRTSADDVKRIRQIQHLLQPDHSCTGSGGITVHADGSESSHHRPCPGCERQRARLMGERPDLFPPPKPSLYDRIETWRKQFHTYGTKDSGDYRGDEIAQYYQGMASGLTIALQEIDLKRYEAAVLPGPQDPEQREVTNESPIIGKAYDEPVEVKP